MPSNPHPNASHKPYFSHLQLIDMPSIQVYKASPSL